MRCPKCNYVSFDLVESCVKCGKNISDAATELQGTVVGVEAPSFLRMSGEEASPEGFEETAGRDSEVSLDLGDEGEEEAMDFSFEEEPSDEADMEMDLGEEDAPGFGLEVEEESAEEPLAEDDAIGISDLAPSEEIEDVAIDEPVEEELEVAAEEAGATGLGLEDLKVDGIDLDSTAGAGASSDEVTPSVKTGTALDDFDFDLGDLLTTKDD